jgi:hypothetical protein
MSQFCERVRWKKTTVAENLGYGASGAAVRGRMISRSFGLADTRGHRGSKG